jgi:hypothetical protein
MKHIIFLMLYGGMPVAMLCCSGKDAPIQENIVVEQQYPDRMVVPGNQWNELATQISLPPEYQYIKTYTTTIGRDTLIEGMTYYQLLTARDQSSSIWESNGFVREDTVTQRVYYKPHGKAELLLYAFQVQVGDTLQSYSYMSDRDEILIAIVKSVDSVPIGATWRKRIAIHSTCQDESYADGAYHTWVEGIGGLDGFLNGISGFALDGGERYSLLCFLQRGSLAYKPEDTGFEGCFVWTAGNIINY